MPRSAFPYDVTRTSCTESSTEKYDVASFWWPDYHPNMIFPDQSRAARALLNWSQPELAQASGVSVSTIRDFEIGKRTPIGNNLAAMRRALEKAGIEFIDDGVRFQTLKVGDRVYQTKRGHAGPSSETLAQSRVGEVIEVGVVTDVKRSLEDGRQVLVKVRYGDTELDWLPQRSFRLHDATALDEAVMRRMRLTPRTDHKL